MIEGGSYAILKKWQSQRKHIFRA